MLWSLVTVVLMLGSSNARGKHISTPKDINQEARLAGIQKNFPCADTEPIRGPVDINMEAGMMNIQIHCPFPAPIWWINSTLYEPLSLNPPLHLNGLGINISVLLESYNNTEFQCFSPCGSQMCVQKSTTGHLTVTKSSYPNFQPPKNEYFHQRIILDHRRFNLSQVNRTIAWKLKSNHSCTLPLTFVVKLSRCITNSVVKTWTTCDYELTLPASAFVADDQLLCLSIETNVTSKSNCSSKSLQFTLSPNAYSREIPLVLKDEGCLRIPVIFKEQGLYAVWPSDHDENEDCICPLCDDGNCVLNNCECYNSTLGPKIIRDSQTDNFSLCWPDIQTDKNGSHVYFFYEMSADQSQYMPVIRNYDVAYNIIIEGPPVAPNLSIIWSEICFSAYSYYHIDYYIIKIIDLIGDVKQMQVIASNITNCIQATGEYFMAECYPYSIYVQAHNKAGLSNASSMTLPGSDEIDSCSCIQQKIEVVIKAISKTISSAQLQINCTTKLNSSVKVTLVFLELMNDAVEHSSMNDTIECPINTTKTLHGLHPNTKYAIVAEYQHGSVSDSIECSLQTFTTKSSQHLTTIIVSTSVPAVIIVVVILCIFCGTMICLCRKKKTADEDDHDHLIQPGGDVQEDAHDQIRNEPIARNPVLHNIRNFSGPV